MTPKTPSVLWWVPPIRRTSSSDAIRLRGVAHTMKPMARTNRRNLMYFRYRSEPGIRSMPSHR